MYKDKELKKRRDRERQQRRRDKQKGVTPEGVTSEKFDGFDVKYNESRPGLFVLPQTAPTTQKPDEQEAAQCVKSDKVIVQQPDISLLPYGVSKPTGQRNAETEAMTSQQLCTCMRYSKGIEWLHSPEYAEVIHRLLTLSIEELDEQGQFVPGWRLRMDATAAPVSVGKAEPVFSAESLAETQEMHQMLRELPARQ